VRWARQVLQVWFEARICWQTYSLPQIQKGFMGGALSESSLRRFPLVPGVKSAKAAPNEFSHPANVFRMTGSMISWQIVNFQM